MRITRENFWKEINKVHPVLFENSLDGIRKLCEVMSSIVFQMLPNRLYQYRSFSSDNDSIGHNVLHLINDEIWGTRISKENDQYEIFPYFGKEEMKDLFQEGINLQADLASITEDKIRKAFPIIGSIMGDDGYRLFVEFCKDPNTLTLLSKLTECIKNGIDELDLDGILQGVRRRLDGTCLACFTENDFSTLMEANYSRGSTGFVVEYDSLDLIQKCEKINECNMEYGRRTGGLLIPLYPVNYSNERIDLSRIIAVSMLSIYSSFLANCTIEGLGWQFIDYLADLKIICWKKEEWKYKNEWRMISFYPPGENRKDDHILLKKVKALSVSVFDRTTPDNRENMKSICREKGIPLYILKEDISSKNCNTFIRDRII